MLGEIIESIHVHDHFIGRKYINILRDTQFVHNNTILQSYDQDFIRTLVVIEFDKAVSLNDFPVRSAGIVVTCYQLCIIMVIS
ncbi:unnamed protein product [Rotaria sordida]|uniref:Uncharacterized protein n=1 Tax=Rotaria sordida TaxID=392033 RepID=A0A814HFB4_9BILA|nr:unnamed protein product [Rotaria sordida]CAF1109250.1 unnamed protein product [Rotaria sordida]CAF1149591.1 unnamed protein product [Rotaria sordida]